MATKLLSSLNSEQRRAVEAADGPMVIIAGPGSGKTRTLTARIAHLVESGRAQPEQILALTFTKKAAEEMAGRLRVMLNTSSLPKVHTFHGLCYELLGADMSFVSDVQRLAVIKDLPRPKALKGFSVRELALVISRAKNQTQVDEPQLSKLVQTYNQALAEQGLRDFDDLLLEAYELLKTDEAAHLAVQDRYHYILVDEFQDTNHLQYEILKLLMGNDNLTVIGDPNQSIYGFRGASGTIFEEFKRDFPSHQAITLGTNYRSVPEVVKLANALFEDVQDQQAQSQASGLVRVVQVLNEYSEAQWVLGEIQRAIGGGDFLKAVSDDQRSQHRRLSDFAVLYRSRSAAMTFQKLLAESGLPYQVVGDGSPYDRPEVQALIASLRTANSDEGPSEAPSVLAEKLIAASGREPSRELQQFVGLLVRFKDVSSALAYIDKIAEEGFYDPDADAITLLTIHASKGLEFPVAFLIGAEDGILPSRRGDEAEERRLLYVAVTRAQEHLELLYAENRGGQPAELSRFIAGLPGEVLERTIDPEMITQARRSAKRAAKKSQQSLF